MFSQWGVDPKAQALANALRSNSWFAYGTLTLVVKAPLGGRQGCKIGGAVFNAVYAIALVAIRDELETEGIFLSVQTASGVPFLRELRNANRPSKSTSRKLSMLLLLTTKL